MDRYGMVLPPQYAAVGQLWSMHFGPMVRHISPAGFDFTVTISPALDAHAQDANVYSSTPIAGDIGSHTVTVVCKLTGVEVDRATTTLTVVADSLATTEVLTVGDSITSFGYYQQDLEALSANLTCVGTQAGIDVPSVQTEGYGGKTAFWLAGNVSSPFVNAAVIDIPNYLTILGTTPDVVVWLLGTNDARQRNSYATSINRISYLEDLIAAWESNNPTVQHVICGCPPGRPASEGALEQSLVDAWSLWTERLLRDFTDTATRTLCGSYTALLRDGTTHYSIGDGFHPTTLGHEFLARSIYPAIIAARA